MNISVDEKNLINVIACVKSGYVGEGDDRRQLYQIVCQIGDRVVNQYSTRELNTGLYLPVPNIQYLKVQDDKGNIKSKSMIIARIGEQVSI